MWASLRVLFFMMKVLKDVWWFVFHASQYLGTGKRNGRSWCRINEKKSSGVKQCFFKQITNWGFDEGRF